MATHTSRVRRDESAPADAVPVRPEQLFFDDPAVDRIMGVLMSLATEHYVLLDRVRALEAQLVQAGIVDRTRLGEAPAPEADASVQADAAEFAEELLRPVLGQQQALGATGRFSLRKRTGRARRRA